ncbi:hypothetical protein Tsubulata_022290 [Turnera subulata]|uniref:Uncharacterized protein n=1 Tax=Turnera subulata TaxID=218843 RepID=A0A9Q0JSL5_9ROSI|nr:hypothetical protein Tsubulata_022290 [Turnera subulata]
MGNCFTSSNKNASGNALQQSLATKMGDHRSANAITNIEPSNHVEGVKRKIVRVKVGEEGDIEKGGFGEAANQAGVRIRIVVTRKELKQILSHNSNDLIKHSSVEQLVRAMKLRERRVHAAKTAGDGDISAGNWRPALASIPEEQ